VQEQVSAADMRAGVYAGAEEALEALRLAYGAGDPYRIVIADFQMPLTNGAELAAAIKADTQLADVVFIMLSSMSHWKHRNKMMEASVDAYLVKPVRHSKLIDTLASTWSRRHKTASTSNPLVALRDSVADKFATVRGRALVAEDNPVNQRVALRMLEKLGVRADVASNGHEAIQMFQSIPYDIIFMDCQMPEMNGYEAATEVRRLEGPHRRIPIIAMTAEATEDSRDNCIRVGMDDFVAKPVKLDDLVAALEKHLRTSSLRETVPIRVS
jgi:CheY-like chemotaxis protein